MGEQLKALFERDLADHPPIIMKQLRAMASFDAVSRLSQLASIPTLVVSAEGDRIALPRYGRALANQIKGARFVEIAAAGHALPIQCAEETNALLRGHFLAAEAEVTASATSATRLRD